VQQYSPRAWRLEYKQYPLLDNLYNHPILAGPDKDNYPGQPPGIEQAVAPTFVAIPGRPRIQGGGKLQMSHGLGKQPQDQVKRVPSAFYTFVSM
jgi:hypothetical protein